MTTNYASNLELDDDGNFVDRRKKQDLLEMRQTVREWQQELFTQVRFGKMDYETATTIWGDRVREYLVTIEPLLLTGEGPTFTDPENFEFELDGAEDVYLNAELGIVEVPPPEEYHTLKQQAKQSETIKLPSNETLEPQEQPIVGLKNVIELDTVQASWQVDVYDARRAPSQRLQTRTVQNEVPLNRVTLQNAVRVADEWLQNQGIGIETDSGRDLFKISVRNDPEDYDEPWKEGTPKPQ